jgi:hypothetical protein
MNRTKFEYPDILGPLSSALIMLTLVFAIYFAFDSFRMIEFYFQFYWVKLFAVAVPLILFLMVFIYSLYRNRYIISMRILLIVWYLSLTAIVYLGSMVSSQLVEIYGISKYFFIAYFQSLILIVIATISISAIRKVILIKLAYRREMKR